MMLGLKLLSAPQRVPGCCSCPHGPRWEALHGSDAGPGLQLGPDRLILQHLPETSHDRGQVKGQPPLQRLLTLLSRPLVSLICSWVLQEAKKVSIDQDLKALLCEAPGRCVPYAVVEGEGAARCRCCVPDAL